MKMKWYTVAAAIGALAILASCNAAASIPTTLQVTAGNITNIVYNNGTYTYPTTVAKNSPFGTTFTIKNTSSTTAYNVTGITSSGGSPFSVGGTTNSSVNPGLTMTFTISGTPTSSTTYSTTVSIANNAPDTTPYFKFAYTVTVN